VEASHRLFGLNVFTGKVELDESAMPNAGEDQLAQLQRPGLALDQGFVVIAYGQNTGDCPGPSWSRPRLRRVDPGVGRIAPLLPDRQRPGSGSGVDGWQLSGCRPSRERLRGER
jgi:hypothetical protein